MFGMASSRLLRRGTYSRGALHCPKCATTIHVFKVTDVTEEFSLPCRGCGRRNFYAKRDMDVEQFLDRRVKPRAA
jgi:hypothetical protein